MGHRPDERGASMVEFALLLPVLALILFGIIDFGTLYNNYQSVRQGARDGMRQVVVGDPATGASCTTQGGNVPATGTVHDFICYTKNRVGLGDNTRVRIIWQGPSASQTTACMAARNGLDCPFPAGNPVMVCVQYPASSTTGLLAPFINNKILNTQAETIIETDQPPTTGQGAGDTSLAGAVSGGFGDVHEDSSNNNTAGWPTSCATGKL